MTEKYLNVTLPKLNLLHICTKHLSPFVHVIRTIKSISYTICYVYIELDTKKDQRKILCGDYFDTKNRFSVMQRKQKLTSILRYGCIKS